MWPSGVTRPNASNLNFSAGQVVPNLVTVKLGTDGWVQIFNSSGSTPVIADVAGWYGAAGATTGSRLTPVTPARVLDTRSAAELGNPANPTGTCAPTPCAAIGAGGILTLGVAGAGGVPTAGASAVVLNVTAVGPTAAGYMTVWPATDPTQPNASNLNYAAGQTVANLVAAKLGNRRQGEDLQLCRHHPRHRRCGRVVQRRHQLRPRPRA